MRRTQGTQTLTALMIALALAWATGCSGGEPASVPELPKRICWGVFAPSDIAPLMPAGKKAEIHEDPFLLTNEMDSATCSLYIDGRHGMLLDVKRYEYEREIDWSSWDEANPQPIDVGEAGLTWGTGAGTHIVCDRSKSHADPGKYIRLDITTDRSPDKKKLRAALPDLLQQLATFTKSELNCP